MNKVVLILFSLSLSGSLIALLLFLLKWIIKDRLNKTWHYYIFLIVILRFLLPFGFETSLISMVFNQAEKHIVMERDSSTFIDTRNFSGDLSQKSLDKNVVNSSSLEKILIQYLWLVWLIPVCVLLIRKVIGYQRFIYFVKNGCSEIKDTHVLGVYKEACNKMNIKFCPSIVRNKEIMAPMLIGIFRPIIVLPDTDLIDINLYFIFLHELTHYKRLDIIYKWLVQITVCVHWYNPIVYLISKEINKNCELSCDETVVKGLNKSSRYAYGDMLLGSIKLDKITHYSAVSITLNEDTKLIKERLILIMKHRKKSGSVIFTSALLSIFLLFGAIFVGAYTTPTFTRNSIEAVKNAPAVINEMEMRYYDDVKPEDRWPYLHWIISNNSDKIITDYEMVCLAYDKEGNPMKLIWKQFALTDGYKVTGFTSQSDKSYDQMITLAYKPILPDAKEDLDGGWSLWDGWNQSNGTHDVAYVLACMKKVSFKDGTEWNNPTYNTWINTYKGKSVDLKTLQTYYVEK